jgi:hypothetical protein
VNAIWFVEFHEKKMISQFFPPTFNVIIQWQHLLKFSGRIHYDLEINLQLIKVSSSILFQLHTWIEMIMSKFFVMIARIG